jgi:hypothetical protein
VGGALGVEVGGAHVALERATGHGCARRRVIRLEHEAARLEASCGRCLAMLLDVRLQRRPPLGTPLCSSALNREKVRWSCFSWPAGVSYGAFDCAMFLDSLIRAVPLAMLGAFLDITRSIADIA